MATTERQRAQELFSEVIELSPDARSAYFDKLRGESPDLCRQVEELVAGFESADRARFVAQPAVSAGDTSVDRDLNTIAHPSGISPEDTMSFVSGASQSRTPVESQQPVPLLADDYELLDELGKGGMGIVYRAYQRSLRKHVAVKIIPTRLMQTPEESARFYLEAESAARLDHPGIVPVYGVGESKGVHYYAMALVTGGSLNDFVGADKEGNPKPRLGPRRTAEIMASVSRAVQYAHDHAVIHRDIKPANIMLDEKGQPRLCDFGLAKDTNADDHLTMTGQVMGTPSYMAPEQAQGDSHAVSNRTDVYSLGATIYALLSGKAPFSGDTLYATLSQVQNTAPAALSVNIPLDLRTICDKCLAKKPADRYESAGRLAEDLDRYLKGFPITARPLGPAQRMVRWSQRNPAIASLIGAVAATLVIATIVSINYGVQASRNLAQARFNADELDAAIKDTFVFASEELADVPGMEKTRQTLLESARRYYEKMLSQKQIDPAEAIEVIFMLGNTQRQLGDWDTARQSFDRTLELQEKFLQATNRDTPTNELVKTLAAVAQTHREYAELGQSIWLEGVEARSAPMKKQGLAILVAHSRLSDELRARAVDVAPTNDEFKRKRANSLMNFGVSLVQQSLEDKDPAGLAEAKQRLIEAQEIRQSIRDSHEKPHQVEIDLALGGVALADALTYEADGSTEETAARELRLEALNLRNQAITTMNNVPASLRSRLNDERLAVWCRASAESYLVFEQYEYAIYSYRKSLEAMRLLLVRFPNVTRYRVLAAETYYMVGQMLLLHNEVGWELEFQRCQDTFLEGALIDPGDRQPFDQLVEYSTRIATLLSEAKEPKLAIAQLERATEMLEKLAPEVRKQAIVDESIKKLDEAREEIRKQAEDAGESQTT